MTKLTPSRNKKGKIVQLKVSIPTEIIKLKGWNDKTELIFTPYIPDPNCKITKDTAIILKEIGDEDEPKKK